MENQLIAYISQFIELNEEEIKTISSKVPIKHYQAGDILLREGEVARVAYFNIKGCVRRYHLIDGEEKTTFFFTENQFVSSIRSFTTNSPADHYLECLEDCSLALIPYGLEKELFLQFPKLETFARISLEQELGVYQEMLSTYLTSNPEQRYRSLLKNSPDLLQRVPLYHLASYIGIKAESLSRIRKRISKNPSE